MKGKLEFELPQEQQEFHYAVKGVAYSIVIEDLMQLLRELRKRGDSNIEIDFLVEYVHNAMLERGLNEYN